MAKKELKIYFPHEADARNDEKLIRLRMRHGAAGYGVYFMILERLRSETDYMSARDYEMIAFDLRVDVSLIESVVEESGLFVLSEDGRSFYSESFMRRMEAKDAVSRRRKEAAKSRWTEPDDMQNDMTDANAMQMHTETDANASRNGCKKTASEAKNGSEAAADAKVMQMQCKCIKKPMQMHTETDANASKTGCNKNKINKKISPDGDIQKDPSPPPPVMSESDRRFSRLTLTEKLECLWQQPEWVTEICSSFKMEAAALRELIDTDFRSHCVREGKNHFSVQDLKSHVNRWLNKRQTLTNNADSRLTDTANRGFSQRDEEFRAHIAAKLNGPDATAPDIGGYY